MLCLELISLYVKDDGFRPGEVSMTEMAGSLCHIPTYASRVCFLDADPYGWLDTLVRAFTG